MSQLTRRKPGDKQKEAASNAGSDKDLYVKLIEEGAEKAPEKVRPYIKQLAPYLAQAWIYFQVALPYIVTGIQKAQALAAQLPEKIIYAILGFLVCFFGGVFPATIAAAEAWRLCGGMEAISSLKGLIEEFSKFEAANKEDNKKDDDGDGVPDVQQMAGKEIMARKVGLALKAVDPKRVNYSLACIYTGWVGVVATLKIQFAKTVTLGEAIGNKLHELVASRAEPALKQMVSVSFGEDYVKWVPQVLQWLCKIIAISIAWWVQRITSAVHSAIRGGHMCAQYLVDYDRSHNIYLHGLGDRAEEVIGWGFTVLGLIFQFMTGFSIPFPLNLIAWPLHIVEYFIQWSVSS